LADETLPPPPQDPRTVDQALEELLAERHYREGLGLGYGDSVETFFENLRQRIQDLLLAIIDLRENDPLLYWMLVVALVSLAGFMVWHIVYTVRKGSSVPASAASTLGDLVDEPDVDALWRRFQEAEAAGDLPGALRLRFAIAASYSLGFARLRSLGHLTYRELLRLTARTAPVTGLEQMVGAIEQTYYAGQPLDEERYRACVTAVGGGRPR
jgi:hypothetical protein